MSIIEVDGPAMAYFIDHEESNKYRTLAIMGKEPNDLALTMTRTIEHIKSALGDGFIYWRLRPEFTDLDQRENHGMYKMWCRIATSPQLTREFWDNMSSLKAEGDDFNMIEGGRS